MFGHKTKRTPSPAPAGVDAALLRSLAGIDASRAEDLIATTRLVSQPPGPVEASADDKVAYLVSGSLRFVTHAGATSTLAANQPTARFPLPGASRVARIEATTPTLLVWLPRSALTDRTAVPPEMPALDAHERKALDALHEHLQSPHFELPSLPDLAIRIGAAIDKANTTSEDIARLILLDPVLATRILSVVNSAAFGGVSQIANIQQATTRLGRSKVRSLVFSCLLKSIFRVPSGELQRRMEHIWQYSAQVAALSYVLGKATPGIDAERALLAGLIHDIGAVSIVGALGRFPALTRRDPVFDYVLASLQVDSALRIATHWHLAPELVAVVREAHDWFRIGTALADDTDIVIIARLHAAFGTPSARELPSLEKLPAFGKLANGDLTPQRSLVALERAAADVREVQTLIAA
ncbi:MAG: HDOD domain-containing protein [Gammaproteobacteria bacterium]|nr:HDOD domain-containing protein [Gammaproteobacteria bacterium]